MDGKKKLSSKKNVSIPVIKIEKEDYISFILLLTEWIETSCAKGIITKNGNSKRTYAQKDTALNFLSCISRSFKLNISINISEFHFNRRILIFTFSKIQLNFLYIDS